MLEPAATARHTQAGPPDAVSAAGRPSTSALMWPGTQGPTAESLPEARDAEQKQGLPALLPRLLTQGLGAFSLWPWGEKRACRKQKGHRDAETCRLQMERFSASFSWLQWECGASKLNRKEKLVPVDGNE